MQHPPADLDDLAGLLSERDELDGRDSATGRVVPAEQSLHLGDAVAVQVDDGLVVEEELPLRQGGAQLDADGPPGEDGLVQRGIEDEDGVRLSAGLGLVHRGIGSPEQLIGVDLVARRLGDADAGVNRDPPVAQGDRPADGGRDTLAGAPRALRPPALLQDDRELVAAEPSCGVAAPHRPGQARADLPEHGVAGRVAHGVVDRLELVKVQAEDRERPVVPAVAGGGVGQPVAEQGPVGQAGERVVKRLVGQLVGQLRLGGNVADVGHQPGDVRIPAQVGEGHPPCAARWAWRPAPPAAGVRRSAGRAGEGGRPGVGRVSVRNLDGDGHRGTRRGRSPLPGRLQSGPTRRVEAGEQLGVAVVPVRAEHRRRRR